MDWDEDEDNYYDCTEADRTYEPAWLSEPRGFIDYREAAADALNTFISAHLGFAVLSWATSCRRWVFRFQDLEIELIHDLDRPLVIAAWSSTLPRKYLDGVRTWLRYILECSLLEPTWSVTGFGVMLLQMTEEAEDWLQAWRLSKIPKTKTSDTATEGWDSAALGSYTALLSNHFGLNMMTANDTAQHLLGQPIKDICKDFPSHLRILHVEPVFRTDLVTKFLLKQSRMKDRLLRFSLAELKTCLTHAEMTKRGILDTREAIAAALVEPSVTFHGAPRHVVSSIIRYGFVVPGHKLGNTKISLEIRCGASFGVGIYSSPSPLYASYYTSYQPTQASVGPSRFGFTSPSSVPGMRLLVCATLMGRAISVTRSQARRKEGLLDREADSHVSPEKLEYIVFESSQILPCYCLHVDYGAEYAQTELQALFNGPARRGFVPAKRRDQRSYGLEWLQEGSPAALQAKKQALRNAAMKWFPFGFGPATGTQFVVEEVGEVDDEEEEYGEFQALRGEEEEERQMGERRVEEGASWFDEYQTVRKSNKEVVVRRDEDEW